MDPQSVRSEAARRASLASEVQRIFGMQPDLDRGNVIPLPDGQGGVMAPQWVYEIAKALTLPGHVQRGGAWSPEDVTNMALTVGGSAGAASLAAPAPKGALASNTIRKAGISGEDFKGLLSIPERKYSRVMDRIESSGVPADADKEMIFRELKTAWGKQGDRFDNKYVRDPLAVPGRAKAELDYRRASERRASEAAAAAAERAKSIDTMKTRFTHPEWSKRFQDEVFKEIDFSRHGDVGQNIGAAVNRANLEAVPRMLRKQGWTVRHASESKGRRSSRYLVSPDGKYEVRVSDHELPDTQSRQHSRQMTGGPRWDDEIVLDGTESPGEVVSTIVESYSNRLSSSGTPAGLLAPQETMTKDDFINRYGRAAWEYGT